jgi:hypothetical protein
MPESTTEAVTKTVVNKNMVKIALDEYNDLVAKAARPVVQNVSVMRMTDSQVAKNNVIWGIGLAAVGSMTALAGIGMAIAGKRAFK